MGTETHVPPPRFPGNLFPQCWLRTSLGPIRSTGALSNIFAIKVEKEELGANTASDRSALRGLLGLEALGRPRPARSRRLAMLRVERFLHRRLRREMQRKPSPAAPAQSGRSCPAVTHQEWGPQGGGRGADQAVRIPAEACCAAGEGGGHRPGWDL